MDNIKASNPEIVYQGPTDAEEERNRETYFTEILVAAHTILTCARDCQYEKKQYTTHRLVLIEGQMRALCDLFLMNPENLK